MARKRDDINFQIKVDTQEQWDEALARKGLIVVDVYQGWSGPCQPLVGYFKKIKNEIGGDLLHFAVAKADTVDTLECYRNKCEPRFLFYAGGVLVAYIKGANLPLIIQTTKEQYAKEDQVLQGLAERQGVVDQIFAKFEQARRTEVDDARKSGTSSRPKSAWSISGRSDFNIDEAQDRYDNIKTKEKEIKRKRREERREEKKRRQRESEEKLKKSLVFIIKPPAVRDGKLPAIIDDLTKRGFGIVTQKERPLTDYEARRFYSSYSHKEGFDDFIKEMIGDPSHILVLTKDDDIFEEMPNTLGPDDVDEAKREVPESLRAQFGTSDSNAVGASHNREQANQDIYMLFPSQDSKPKYEVKRPEHTLVIIRQEEKAKVLLKIVEKGLVVLDTEEIDLNSDRIKELLGDAGDEFINDLAEKHSKHTVLAMALQGVDIHTQWHLSMDELAAERGDEIDPGETPIIHSSRNEENANIELRQFFPKLAFTEHDDDETGSESETELEASAEPSVAGSRENVLKKRVFRKRRKRKGKTPRETVQGESGVEGESYGHPKSQEPAEKGEREEVGSGTKLPPLGSSSTGLEDEKITRGKKERSGSKPSQARISIEGRLVAGDEFSSDELSTFETSESVTKRERILKKRVFRKKKQKDYARGQSSSPEPSDEEARKAWLLRKLKQQQDDSQEPSDEDARKAWLLRRQKGLEGDSAEPSDEEAKKAWLLRRQRKQQDDSPEPSDEEARKAWLLRRQKKQEGDSPEPSDEEARKAWLLRRQKQQEGESPEPSDEDARKAWLLRRQKKQEGDSPEPSDEEARKAWLLRRQKQQEGESPEPSDEEARKSWLLRRQRKQEGDSLEPSDEEARQAWLLRRQKPESHKGEELGSRATSAQKDGDRSRRGSRIEKEGTSPEPSDAEAKEKWLQRKCERAERHKRQKEDQDSKSKSSEADRNGSKIYGRRQGEGETSPEPSDESERKKWRQRREDRAKSNKWGAEGDLAIDVETEEEVEDASPEPSDVELKKQWLLRRQHRRDGKEREYRVYRRTPRYKRTSGLKSELEAEKGVEEESDEWSYSGGEEGAKAGDDPGGSKTRQRETGYRRSKGWYPEKRERSNRIPHPPADGEGDRRDTGYRRRKGWAPSERDRNDPEYKKRYPEEEEKKKHDDYTKFLRTERVPRERKRPESEDVPTKRDTGYRKRKGWFPKERDRKDITFIEFKREYKKRYPGQSDEMMRSEFKIYQHSEEDPPDPQDDIRHEMPKPKVVPKKPQDVPKTEKRPVSEPRRKSVDSARSKKEEKDKPKDIPKTRHREKSVTKSTGSLKREPSVKSLKGEKPKVKQTEKPPPPEKEKSVTKSTRSLKREPSVKSLKEEKEKPKIKAKDVKKIEKPTPPEKEKSVTKSTRSSKREPSVKSLKEEKPIVIPKQKEKPKEVAKPKEKPHAVQKTKSQEKFVTKSTTSLKSEHSVKSKKDEKPKDVLKTKEKPPPETKSKSKAPAKVPKEKEEKAKDEKQPTPIERPKSKTKEEKDKPKGVPKTEKKPEKSKKEPAQKKEQHESKDDKKPEEKPKEKTAISKESKESKTKKEQPAKVKREYTSESLAYARHLTAHKDVKEHISRENTISSKQGVTIPSWVDTGKLSVQQGMEYNEGAIIIPETGPFFAYCNMYQKNDRKKKGFVEVSICRQGVKSKKVQTMLKSRPPPAPDPGLSTLIHVDSILHLNEGDRVFVKVSDVDRIITHPPFNDYNNFGIFSS